MASLVAQMVKRLPAMRETWVRSLGQENFLEKEMAIHSSTLTWKILVGSSVHGVAKSQTRLSDFTSFRTWLLLSVFIGKTFLEANDNYFKISVEHSCPTCQMNEVLLSKDLRHKRFS